MVTKGSTGLLVLGLIIIELIGYSWCDMCSTPAKEGQSYWIRNTVALRSCVNGWRFSKSRNNNFFSCVNSNGQTACNQSPNSNDYLTEARTTSDGRYEISLKINSVTRPRDEGMFSINCISGNNLPPGLGTPIALCSLDIYHFESTPICEPVSYSGTPHDTVMWQCSIKNVFPKGDCIFKFEKDGKGFDDEVGSEYVTVSNQIMSSSDKVKGDDVSDDPEYYECQCTMRLPASHLSSGRHKFKVTIIPRLSNDSHSLSLGKSTVSADFTTDNEKDDDGLGVGGAVGITVTIAIIFCIIAFLLGMVFQKRRTTEVPETDKQPVRFHPSTVISYDRNAPRHHQVQEGYLSVTTPPATRTEAKSGVNQIRPPPNQSRDPIRRPPVENRNSNQQRPPNARVPEESLEYSSTDHYSYIEVEDDPNYSTAYSEGYESPDDSIPCESDHTHQKLSNKTNENDIKYNNNNISYPRKKSINC